MEAIIENTQKHEKTGRFTRLKLFLDTPRTENLILWIYTAFSFFLVLIHEPWRDEAQFWLLARDASLPEILGNISKEGIPPLWQLILKPFVLLGLPYYPTMIIISTLLVVAAAWIFVKKAPFQRCVKYILLFSPVFIYCYATISRSYALIPIIFVLLAVVYPKRHQQPVLYGLLVALLFEVHVFLWGMVAALSLEFLISTIQEYKKDKSIKKVARSFTAAIPLLIVALQYLIQFYPGAKASNTLNDFTLKTNPLSIVSHLLRGIESVFGNTLAGQQFVGFYLALIFTVFSILSIVRNMRWIKYVLIAGAAILFEAIISGFVYQDGNYRSISVFLILTFVIWLAKNDDLPLEIALFNTRTTWVAVVCAYTFFGMLTVVPGIAEDVLHPYSNSQFTAAYIEKNISPDSLVLTSSSAQMSALSVYLEDYTFYDSEKEKPFTYFVWDNNASWVDLYGVEINGEKKLTQDNRLSLVAQEAIELSNGNGDGFFYISVPDYMTNDADTFYLSHMIYQTPEEQESWDNYEILYIPFEDVKQLIDNDSNPG
ncbi:MAG: hypothetical protein VB061_04620 [Christensenella sp.]|nr:hypothetical protein [Christensenella sp.]